MSHITVAIWYLSHTTMAHWYLSDTTVELNLVFFYRSMTFGRLLLHTRCRWTYSGWWLWLTLGDGNSDPLLAKLSAHTTVTIWYFSHTTVTIWYLPSTTVVPSDICHTKQWPYVICHIQQLQSNTCQTQQWPSDILNTHQCPSDVTYKSGQLIFVKTTVAIW